MPRAVEKQKVKEALKQRVSADELLDQLLEALEPPELEELYRNIVKAEEEKQVPKHGLAQKLQTREYSKKERIELEFASLYKFFEHRRKLLESALTPTQVGTLLNTTRQ